MVAVSPVKRDEVHRALECLYDNVALAAEPLLERFPQLPALARLDERAERARALILEAVEVLRPARGAPFGSPESRLYDILSLRYVENLQLTQVGRELSLSRRQVYRDLAEAEEQLTRVLASWMGGSLPDDASKSGRPSDELAALSGRVNLQHLLGEAVAVVRPLATKLGVQVTAPADVADQDLVSADASVLKHVIVQALSAAIQSRPRGGVVLAMEGSGGERRLSVSPKHQTGSLPREVLEGAERLAVAQGIDFRVVESAGGAVRVLLSLPRTQTGSVLVIEDNPGAVELYRRFLAGTGWQVSDQPDARLALETARRSRPDVVILDIIMPGADGWSVIRELREHRETAALPLIVCSVLEDPRLAEALGASAYLKKPVSRAGLLAALDECLPLSPFPRDSDSEQRP